ncbi:MAG: hypothetical protein FJ202_06845 [Gemmatimonadetes bacterium]|nr:hypothetical protein [Gemmatimonadota bacterium]
MTRAQRLALACLTAGIAWIVVEVAGGLAFLAAGVRLWRYEIAPLWFEITSPVVWAFAVLLIVPLSVTFDRAVMHHIPPRYRLGVHLAFLMVTGSILEVAINEWVFRAAFGRPLYEYLVLPTFGGSGSLLSPLYYATLLIHRPVCRWILGDVWDSRPSPTAAIGQNDPSLRGARVG